MKFTLHKDFCVWLVSPSDGKVKKLRFSLLRALSVSFVGAVIVGVFLYIAGDYARVHISKAKQRFSLRRVMSERDALRALNKSLSASLKDLKTDKMKAVDYERSVRERLDELSGLLDSAASLGVIERKPHGKHKYSLKRGKGGLGGGEVDECVLGDASCSGKAFAYDWEPGSARAMLRPDFAKATRDPRNLLQTIEGHITTLRSVPIGQPVTDGVVNSPFGVRFSPFGQRMKMHQGVDFGAPYGSAVRATAEGVVSAVKRTHTYGIMVDVRHGENVITRYAHLSRALVKEGQRVNRGHAVGLLGATGRATGPHLH
jgi:murein DD-endopeptidase MepM/ murein hydrolase activator NlpD